MAAAKNTAKKVESLVEDAQKAANDQVAKITKSFEDAAAFNQENVDAMVKTSSLAVKAVEEMNAEIASYSKKTFEEGVAAAKELSTIKTVPEFVEKQAELAKAQFDGFVKQTARFNEMYLAAAKEVYAPINDRATAAAEIVKNFRA